MIDALARLFGRPTFAHGVHPPELKSETQSLPIRQFPFAPLFIVSLSQHIGTPARPIVGEGDRVVRGQTIADPDGFVSVAIHSPATGIVRRIAPSPAISGKMEPSFLIEPLPASTQEIVHSQPACNADDPPPRIIEAIQKAGIVGLGGAGFPTHAKLTVPPEKVVDTIIVNGAECEPYLTTDHRVMLEHADDIIAGIPLVLKATAARKVVIAIEGNKRDAAESLSNANSENLPVEIKVLPVKYPQGAEKMMIKSVLDREVPSGGLPIDAGALCINVGTLAQIGNLLPKGQGLVDRVITVSGPAIEKKGNYRIPIGTPLRFILDTVGTVDSLTSVVMGGPMMGSTASHLDISISKGSTGVIGLSDTQSDAMTTRPEFPCIRCATCLDACPLFLNPAQLGLLAINERYQEMASEFNLLDCFECGCCTYVCPSHIPLVQRFRVAKKALRKSNPSE